MAKVTPISELRRTTKTVVCPACEQQGETFKVVDEFTTSQTARLAAVSVVTAGIPAISYLRGPRANWLAHYCRSCGIRLTTYIQAGDAVFPLTDAALKMLIDGILSMSSTTSFPARIARSPLGPPPQVVNFNELASFADRYRSSLPDLILDVDWNKYYDMPVSFRTMDRSKVYDVTFPDFDLDGKLSGSMFFPSRRDPHYLYAHDWSHQNANIRITNTQHQPERVAGLVQLSQMKWDVTLYFPQTRGKEQPGRTSTPISYNFAHHGIGSDQLVFARAHPHFLWTSSEGPLLWTIQRCTDGLTPAGIPSEARLILLDCYDRLLAMEHCKGDARWKKWDAAPRDYTLKSHLNLRFYNALSEKMVDEIVVSYAAISAQMRRKGDWDIVNLSD